MRSHAVAVMRFAQVVFLLALEAALRRVRELKHIGRGVRPEGPEEMSW